MRPHLVQDIEGIRTALEDDAGIDVFSKLEKEERVDACIICEQDSSWGLANQAHSPNKRG